MSSVPACRTVVIRGCGPSSGSPYGTMPLGPLNMWPTAQPGAFLDYAADVSALLNDETITAASLTVSPSGAGELIPAFLSVSGCLVSWWGWGGVPGRHYTVRIMLQTSAVRTIVFTVGLLIDPLLAPYPIPPAPVPGPGTPLIWSEGTPMFGPSVTLPATTVLATGTTQLTAAPATLSQILVNAATAAGAGILLPQASAFCGQTVPVYNRSGVTITIYPYSGDQIEGLGANTGTDLENEQTASFTVSQSGALLLS